MTINQFCEKYGIDRPFVYSATWMIPCKVHAYRRNMEYDEDELKNAVIKAARNREENYREKHEQAVEMLRKLGL